MVHWIQSVRKEISLFSFKKYLKKYFIIVTDENVIGLSLQEILPDNNNIKAEKMLVSNPPNILKRSKSMRLDNSVSFVVFFFAFALEILLRLCFCINDRFCLLTFYYTLK